MSSLLKRRLSPGSKKDVYASSKNMQSAKLGFMQTDSTKRGMIQSDVDVDFCGGVLMLATNVTVSVYGSRGLFVLLTIVSVLPEDVA